MKKTLICLLLTAVLFTGCTANHSDNVPPAASKETLSAESNPSNPQPSEEVSEEPYYLTFEASTIEGEEFTSACFENSKLTMINVWATYCGPCLNEMPDLGEIASEYEAEDFQLIGIISDVMEGDDTEKITNAAELIEETKAAYPHLLLNQSLYNNLVGAVTSVPTTFFIAQNGEVLGYIIGANSKDAWIDLIDQILTEME